MWQNGNDIMIMVICFNYSLLFIVIVIEMIYSYSWWLLKVIIIIIIIDNYYSFIVGDRKRDCDGHNSKLQ